MKKMLKVFANEYGKHVLKKRFIFMILSVPLIILFIAGFAFLMVFLRVNHTPIGYVDQAGIIQDAAYGRTETGFFRSVEMREYTDIDQLRADVTTEVLQGGYVIAKDYLQTGDVTLIEKGTIGTNASEDFESMLRHNVFAGLPAETANRLIEGNSIEVTSLDGARQASAANVLNMILPIAIGIVMVIIVNVAGGYFLQALVDEKENRTMEIMITSVSPQQLMMGKILADICVGLTQMAVWGAFIGIGLVASLFISPWVAGQTIDFGNLYLSLAILPAAFLLVGGLMATIGVMMTDNKEAGQATGIFSMALFIPTMLLSPLMSSPNSLLAVALSLFPLTSPITLLIRAAFTTIPTWQLVASLGILYLSAFGMIWLAGKALKVGMLQYGKKLTLRQVFQRGY